jgi:transcriptional regulator GlxA family with amidase domain
MYRIILLLTFLSLHACGQGGKESKKISRANEAFYCLPCNSSCDTIAHASAGMCAHCGMELIARKPEDVKKIAAALQRRLTVAIFIHDGVELLDFAGPGEVFSQSGFDVFTVGSTQDVITSQGFLKVTPQYSIKNCPKPDIIVLPGGATEIPMANAEVINWVKQSVPNTVITLSVCTGAGLLSKAGLLDGMTVTTFHNFIDALQRMTPKAKVVRNTRFVDNGSIVTTAGISAGIDGALHVVSKLKGREVAQAAADNMEYDKWISEEGLIMDTPERVKKARP